MTTKTVLTDLALSFYVQEGDSDFYKCVVCNPNKRVSGKKKFNLVSHLRSCHPDKFEISSETSELDIKKERLRIIQSLSEIVTVNGRPFNCLSDSGLLRLIRKDLDGLENARHGIVTNKNWLEVKEYVKHIASEIQKEIGADVQNKIISVLLDIGSRNGKSILGVAIQFMKDDVIGNKTIGMIPLSKSHTVSYIIDELKECLKTYSIDINQIIAFVSDNASNMIAAAKRLDEFIIGQNENTENISDDLPNFGHANLSRE